MTVAETEDAKEKEAADKALALDRTPLSMGQKVDAVSSARASRNAHRTPSQ